MHCACEGAVLLVGEGDFSLALALVSCEGGLRPAQVVATTVETEESLHKHSLAEDNVRQLLEKGGSIVYAVDGRDLQNCPTLGHATFTRIIFNFPHAGGKSDLKRNRALLNEFFQSAVQVLAEGGEVMVTLCRGQGGTPADNPRRAWHDSWQVQAMAANAALILTGVLPFHAEQYPQYNSVGFRSQDKGFHTEGALTHIFQTAEVVSASIGSLSLTASLELPEGCYLCPTYLQSRLSRCLLQTEGCPLRVVARELEGKLVRSLGCLRLPPPSSPISPLPLASPPLPELPVEVVSATPEAAGPTGATSGHCCHLRASMLDCVPACLAALRAADSRMKGAITSGPVYSQCFISPARLPVSHQMLVVCRKPDAATAVAASCAALTGRPCQVVSTEEKAHVKVPEHGTLCASQLIAVAGSDDGDGDGDDDVRIGCVWSEEESESEKMCSTFAIILDLDLLTQLVFDIPGPRLMWSHDPRCLRQFRAGLGSKFKPISLYPLSFEHDMSFWEPQGREFDEMAFHQVLQSVAGDVLTCVQLIDTYEEGERRSRCYRMTFTSQDHALPYITSWKLQSNVRLAAARALDLQLR